jgi:hypothetical protein
MTTKSKALQSLRPGAQWVLRGGDLEWLDTEQTQPTDAEITEEVVRLEAEYEAKEYQRKRAAEYPPMSDYLDGVVKGDQAQIDADVAACLAVKAKYPKEQP